MDYGEMDDAFVETGVRTLIYYPNTTNWKNCQIANDQKNVDGSAIEETTAYPDNVTTIGEHAFSCVHLKEVILSKSLETIGKKAFDCYYLGLVKFKTSSVSCEVDAIKTYSPCTMLYPKNGDSSAFVWQDKDLSVIFKKMIAYDPNDSRGYYIVHKVGKVTITITDEGNEIYNSVSKSFDITVKELENDGDSEQPTQDVGSSNESPSNNGANNNSTPVESTNNISISVENKTDNSSSNLSSKPKATSIIKLMNKKGKKLYITWKKMNEIAGYNIQYSTSSYFKTGIKSFDIKNNTITNKKVTKLKKNKKYYVRIRTYKIVGRKKVYSSWCKKKVLKIKK